MKENPAVASEDGLQPIGLQFLLQLHCGYC